MPAVSFRVEQTSLNAQDLQTATASKQKKVDIPYRSTEQPEVAVNRWLEENSGWKLIKGSIVLGYNRS